jgi:hypothetical protein
LLKGWFYICFSQYFTFPRYVKIGGKQFHANYIHCVITVFKSHIIYENPHFPFVSLSLPKKMNWNIGNLFIGEHSFCIAISRVNLPNRYVLVCVDEWNSIRRRFHPYPYFRSWKLNSAGPTGYLLFNIMWIFVQLGSFIHSVDSPCRFFVVLNVRLLLSIVIRYC